MAGSLQQFVEEVNGTSHLRIEYDFGGGFVRLRTSEAERRQARQDIRSSEDILIELLRNARDAGAAFLFVASWKEGTKRHLVVIDDGEGVPTSMHEHIFEPRVTSKLDTSHMDKWGMHGRGMALYSIAVNSECARVVTSDVGQGTSIEVVSNTTALSEKTDQSTFPTFKIDENGVVTVRGPKNLVRTTCEFAIEERRTCTVYFGAPTEILAALYAFGSSRISPIDRAFCRDASTLPVVYRLATAADPESFAQLAASIGIPISERSARRILDGHIEPIAPILVSVRIDPAEQTTTKTAGKPTRGKKPSHTVRVSHADVSAVGAAALDAFKQVAPNYFLNPDVDAKTRQRARSLIVEIPLVDAD